MGRQLELEDVTGGIVNSALHIDRALGPGLLETVYEVVLARKLEARGLPVERRKPVDLEVDGISVGLGFRIDLLVDSRVIVELKSVEKLAPVHWKQLQTYLRLTDLRVGLLINFGAATLSEGLHRVVNRYEDGVRGRLRVARAAEAIHAEMRSSTIDRDR